MEIVKAILAFITSLLNRSTAKSVEEVKLADKTEQAVVETIRATQNAEAVQQHQKTAEAVQEVREKQKQERVEAAKKPLDEQLDDAFGQDE